MVTISPMVAITIATIIVITVVIWSVPSSTESVDEVVQTVAKVVAHICPCGGTSKRSCKIKVNKDKYRTHDGERSPSATTKHKYCAQKKK